MRNDIDKGNDSIVFVKQIDRYNAVVLEVIKDNEDRIVLHKSFYDQNKKPYASEKYKSIRPISSEGGVSSIIHAENSAHGSSLPARDDDAKLGIFSDMDELRRKTTYKKIIYYFCNPKI